MLAMFTLHPSVFISVHNTMNMYGKLPLFAISSFTAPTNDEVLGTTTIPEFLGNSTISLRLPPMPLPFSECAMLSSCPLFSSNHSHFCSYILSLSQPAPLSTSCEAGDSGFTFDGMDNRKMMAAGIETWRYYLMMLAEFFAHLSSATCLAGTKHSMSVRPTAIMQTDTVARYDSFIQHTPADNASRQN